MAKKVTDSDARLAYEVSLGKRVSDNHWYRTRKLLEDNGFEITVDNIHFYSSLRKALPRSSVGVLAIFENYRKAEKLLSASPELVKGCDVLAMLHQHGITPHASTISRWFSDIGGYRKNKLYKAKDLKSVFTAGFLYKAQNSTKLPEAI
jgi:hypothetical protein